MQALIWGIWGTPYKCLHFSILSDLKKTTAVVETLSTTSTRCSVTEITSLLQDSINRMRNLHQILPVLIENYEYDLTLLSASKTMKDLVTQYIYRKEMREKNEQKGNRGSQNKLKVWFFP